jgi:hypothetical protein
MICADIDVGYLLVINEVTTLSTNINIDIDIYYTL